MKRQTFLKNLGLSSLAVLSSESLLSSCMENRNMNVMPQTVKDGEFVNALKIPEIFTPGSTLSAQITQDILVKASSISVYGYHSGLLGPTFKVKNGQNVIIPFQNSLKEASNVHWHGLVIPSNMDGHPDHVIESNKNFIFQFTIDQQAGINWYHPHLHMHTGIQVNKGLAGMFIVESDEENALKLPSDGYDVPLVIQDKRFNADGTINYNPSQMDIMTGYFGDNVLVNGTSKPYLEVSTRFYRFRVLNGSSARIYNLALSNGADFYIIGSDSGMLAQPEKVKNTLLGPGERLDFLIDFSRIKIGEKVHLNSEKFTNMGGSQGGQSFKIISFNVTIQATDSFKMPASLIPFSSIQGSSKTRTFTLSMRMVNMNRGMNTINGKVFKADRIDETVNFGATEIWEFDNTAGIEPHPMHVHGVTFQVLSRTGGRNKIEPHEKTWKDTVLVGPNERIKVVMNFSQKGKFLVHCHNLEHEDDGMMLNFEVV